MNILPQYLEEYKTQLDSIQKTGMSFNRKKMNGRSQINVRGFHRWCFVADVWKCLIRPDISQVPVLNTKEVDVAYLLPIETNPMCGEYWFSDPTLETEWAEEIIKIWR